MPIQFTVVLPALLGFESVAAALDSWETQACRDQFEILIAGPDALGPRVALPAGQRWIPTGSADLHEARAIAIVHAAGEYVVLAEDHCLPDPGWVEAMLPRLADGWDVIGPSFLPGNRDCSWGQGSFLLGYGQWIAPMESGPATVLCGWNGTIRTSRLRELGEALASELLLGVFLLRRWQVQGGRFYLEASAGMRHYDPSGGWNQLYLFLIVGLAFGAVRTQQWPLAGRLLYPLAIPMVAILHARRAIRHYRRAGAVLRSGALGAAMFLSVAWALGEAAGALTGAARASRHVWRTEVKPVRRETVARGMTRAVRQAGARG